ncbi:MAG: Asp23/Gls24 family envelope stress response protein [Aerococcus sp.]|nr:Asp23/Gls24 family envelope stress response protein [Aerococcus sp.]
MTSQESNPLVHREAIGDVNIAPNVIETIAEQALENFPGIAPVEWYQAGFSGVFRYDRGIMLHHEEGRLILDVVVQAYYQRDIPKTIYALQAYLNEQVMNMTDIKLDEIRIYVNDLIVNAPENNQ